MTLEKTLHDRGMRYGAFIDNANTASAIMVYVDNGAASEALEPMHRVALQMIALKLARLVNGDPNDADSWHDIAGYAELVRTEIVAQEHARELLERQARRDD